MPPSRLSLRHLALNVEQLEACIHFYVDLLGMQMIWQPDENNVYLSTGRDNLALHRALSPIDRTHHQSLDHFGFVVATPALVDEWYACLQSHQVLLKNLPRTHRDGSRSFYCCDPEGNVVQIIWLPNFKLIATKY